MNTTIPSRIACIAGGFVAGILIIELAFRGAGLLAAGRLSADYRVADARPIVVFCGDSNIFGVYVEPAETLPAAVERLSQKRGGAGVRCLNFGVPGSASWNTLDQVRHALMLHPAAVVVTCGINNYSTMPTDEGLGILEQLNVVKFIRRSIFNAKVRALQSRGNKLQLGPDGNVLNGFQVAVGDDKSAVSIVDREGVVNTFAQGQLLRPAEPSAVERRMRADFLDMSSACASSGANIVFATYLAGETGLFHDITKTMRAADGAFFADCGAALADALAAGETRPAAEIPYEIATAKMNTMLSADLHPTAIGYELEARVVAESLRITGVLNDYITENPAAPLLAANIMIPRLAAVAGAPDSANIIKIEASNLKKGERVVFLVGARGAGFFTNLPVPIETAQFEKFRAAFPSIDSQVLAGDDGTASLLLPRALLRKLAKPVFAMCVAMRGGRLGASQRFPSAPIEIDPDH
ncbi:MAG: SGNH/GDSL hydrolase family protein [Planctomycetes bacterium]|nr:SGNH/GDSL hydrolase family protein [Planctomycetota bacterium]